MRWMIRLLGAVALIVLLAVGALVLLPAERIATIATDRLSASTGRAVQISGEVRPTLWPHLGIRAEGLQIGNPDWVEDGPLLAAEALAVRVPWSAVLAAEVQVDEITLIAPDITLVRAADGAASWTFAPETAGTTAAAEGDGTAEPAAASAPRRSLGLDLAEVTDGTVLYRDLGSGQSMRITGLDGSVRLPRSGPAALDMRAEVNGTALDLTAEVDGMSALLAGSVTPAALSFAWPGGTAEFAGNLSTRPALDGRVTLIAEDLGPLAALAGQTLPEMPDGYGRERIDFSGQITLASEGSAHLRDGTLVLDDTELALALDLLPGEERPLIRGTVSGNSLRLPSAGSGADAGAGSAGATGGAGGGWSRDPIDVSGLFAADAEIALSVTQLEGAGATVGPVDLRATLERGRLVFDIERIAAYDGVLTGQFVVNGRGGLSVGGDLLLAGVQLSPLLRDVADYDRLQGTGSASLQFLGVGNDMASIMSGLSGQGDLAFGAGAIEGLDLAGMIRNLDTSFQGEGARTVYDSVSANFTIADGVLSNDDLRLDAPWGEVTGSGTVDLGAQTLNYRVIPGLLRGESGAASIRVPVLISGPWASPSFRPDLEFLAEQELAEERERLEAEARERLEAETNRLEAEARARANEALGTGLQEGDTVEDARDQIEQRLRDEAEQQLLRLFGGD